MAIDVKIGMLEEHIGNQSIVWIRILGTERKRKRKMVGVFGMKCLKEVLGGGGDSKIRENYIRRCGNEAPLMRRVDQRILR